MTDAASKYEKLSDLEHVLKRPDTFVGAMEPVEEERWIYDPAQERMVKKKLNLPPAFCSVMDEILTNAQDRQWEEEHVRLIKLSFDLANGKIMVWNDGDGIPVVEKHLEEKEGKRSVLVPSLVFGEFRAGSNFDDTRVRYVGGRNGFGATLTNAFSNEFEVETGDPVRGKRFVQRWRNNMAIVETPKITSYKNKRGFAQVSFILDWNRFGLGGLNEEAQALLVTRAYDVAACTKPSISVELNGERIGVKQFQQYADLFLGADRKAVPRAYECVMDSNRPDLSRLEVCVAYSAEGFQSHGFVNGVRCGRGHHVDLIVKQICDALLARRAGKRGASDTTVPSKAQIKAHLFVLIKVTVDNPAFTTQTKEKLASPPSKWGFSVQLSDAFLNKIEKLGILESASQLAALKQSQQLQRESALGKGGVSRRPAVEKLEDALLARQRGSVCYLILTEGDSAKNLALQGLSVVGKENFGVYPLRGKLLNVREAKHDTILNNTECMAIMKSVGLQFGRNYGTELSVRDLRYSGGLIAFTDQDVDGAHIASLIYNFIDALFPELLKVRPDFVKRFATPIAKATNKGGAKDPLYFLSIPQYNQWERELASESLKRYLIKYLKGLAASTNAEAKLYFKNLDKHLIALRADGPRSRESVDLVFNKHRANDRKEWLANNFDAESYVDYAQDSIFIEDYLDREQIQFSWEDCVRSIPSAIDGLKPGQRKILFALFADRVNEPEKCSDLVGQIGKRAAYHHGPKSLFDTLVLMAQCHHGTNNINLVHGDGQFGSRFSDRSEHGADRYVAACIEPIARALFPTVDDAILSYVTSDGRQVEPVTYAPVLPVVLLNGCSGIGTGHATKVPPFNPLQIVDRLEAALKGKSVGEPLKPWFDLHSGQVEPTDNPKVYDARGIFQVLETDEQGTPTRVQITELPPGCWKDNYKSKYIDPHDVAGEAATKAASEARKESKAAAALSLDEPIAGKRKAKAAGTAKKQKTVVFFITDVLDRSTGNIDIELTLDPVALAPLLESVPLGKLLGLEQSPQSTYVYATNMVLFDCNGKLVHFQSAEEIIEHFIPWRLARYAERKAYLESTLAAELAQLQNKRRFIGAILKGELEFHTQSKGVRNAKPRGQLEQELDSAGYLKIGDSNPFQYLLGMSYLSATAERLAELAAEERKVGEKLAQAKATSATEFWLNDLALFRTEYAQFLLRKEQVLAQEDEEAKPKKRAKPKAKRSAKPKGQALIF